MINKKEADYIRACLSYRVMDTDVFMSLRDEYGSVGDAYEITYNTINQLLKPMGLRLYKSIGENHINEKYLDFVLAPMNSKPGRNK